MGYLKKHGCAYACNTGKLRAIFVAFEHCAVVLTGRLGHNREITYFYLILN